MWTLANPIKHAANEKGLVTNIDSNNLVPSFAGVDARMHISMWLCIRAATLLPQGRLVAARIQDADKMLPHGYLVILDYLVDIYVDMGFDESP